MRTKYALLVLFCAIDIVLPFVSFFILLDQQWPIITAQTFLNSKGWLIAPAAVLILVAIVFIYIISQQFPTDQREGRRLLRNILVSLALLLISSGTAWRTGLFQYSLLEFLALAMTFGVVLLRQRPLVIGWLFGLPALVWSTIALWVSYRLYAATFLITAPWIDWVVWPLWLMAVVPLVKNRYILINGFFVEYHKKHPNV